MSPSSRAGAAEPDAAVELRSERLRLAVRPDLGACIAGLWLDNTPVLLSQPPDALSASRPSGCFPLAPYSNRIGHRRFEWDGQTCTTAPNFGDSPHSLHGVGWLRAWSQVSRSEDALVLRYHHQPDAHWPFAFEVVQRFRLAPDRLSLQLEMTNTDHRAQPAGLGWHPYFPKRPHSHLRAQVSHRWETDASQLPTHTTAHDGIDDDIAQLKLDHCFDGWEGLAQIRDECHALTLTASARRLVVYTPADKGYFCVEPVSHVNNAVQMPDPAAHGLVTLAPGASTDAWMTLEIHTL